MDEGVPRTFWIDENLPPALAQWFSWQEGLRGEHLRQLGMQEMLDQEIYLRAREAAAVIVTKDDDFSNLVATLGPPPQIIWVQTGNLGTAALIELFNTRLDVLLSHLDAGAPLVALK